MEWLGRLLIEPRRFVLSPVVSLSNHLPKGLWKRYLIGNLSYKREAKEAKRLKRLPLFLWRVLKQLALSVSKGLGLLCFDEDAAP